MPARPASETLREYARGAAGGLLFSLPLLYTMEVWWAGHAASPLRLLAFLGGTFGLLVADNWASGLRPDTGWRENTFEAVEELGLGLVTAAVVLFLLGQLPPGGGLPEWVGKVTLEGAVAAVGVSIGTAQLGEGGPEGGRGMARSPLRAFVGEVALAALGAVIVAANVAPTEEIVLVAAEASPGQLLGLAVASLGVAAVLLNYAGVRGSERLGRRRGAFAGFAEGTVVTYAAALLVSAVLLWVFGRFDRAGPAFMLTQTVVLGFPAALGAAAGRLLLGGDEPADDSPDS